LYGEDGTFDADYDVDRGGGILDAEFGVRLRPRLAVRVAHSRGGSEFTSGLTASVPHPVIAGRNRDAEGVAEGLRRTEKSLHLEVLWQLLERGRTTIAVTGGPSFIQVRQDFISAVVIGPEGAPPFDSIQIIGRTLVSNQKTVTGGNVGAEALFDLRDDVGPLGRIGLSNRLAARVFMRFTRATADLGRESGESVTVGGLQVGVGLRARF
jgi:hypothetical protein